MRETQVSCCRLSCCRLSYCRCCWPWHSPGCCRRERDRVSQAPTPVGRASGGDNAGLGPIPLIYKQLEVRKRTKFKVAKPSSGPHILFIFSSSSGVL